MEFETTIPAFERAKTVHVLDGAATVVGQFLYRVSELVLCVISQNLFSKTVPGIKAILRSPKSTQILSRDLSSVDRRCIIPENRVTYRVRVQDVNIGPETPPSSAISTVFC
jgi:hypothetical protein